MCADLFSVRSTSVLPQWHVKEQDHSAKSSGGRFHLNTHSPVTKRSRSGLTTPLSRHSVGTYPETSSHVTCQGRFMPQSSKLVEPPWTDPGLKSGISVRKLISTSKKKKKSAGGGINGRTCSQNPRKREESHQHQTTPSVTESSPSG